MHNKCRGLDAQDLLMLCLPLIDLASFVYFSKHSWFQVSAAECSLLFVPLQKALKSVRNINHRNKFNLCIASFFVVMSYFLYLPWLLSESLINSFSTLYGGTCIMQTPYLSILSRHPVFSSLIAQNVAKRFFP